MQRLLKNFVVKSKTTLTLISCSESGISHAVLTIAMLVVLTLLSLSGMLVAIIGAPEPPPPPPAEEFPLPLLMLCLSSGGEIGPGELSTCGK